MDAFNKRKFKNNEKPQETIIKFSFSDNKISNQLINLLLQVKSIGVQVFFL